MKLLTIIVTYNGMKWLDRCLGSLRESSVPTDVLVVDNGSTDGTLEYIPSAFPQVQLVSTGANLGFGKANNIGLQKAVNEGYDYVYLLNQDAWVAPDTFEKLIGAMKLSPEYGILSPMQLTASWESLDPRFVRWCPPAAWDEWKDQSACLSSDLSSDSQSVSSGRQSVRPVNFVMAAHWMISRACFTKVGGFSPAFAHYGEDDNYVHRAQYHGFKVGILSSAGAVHDREMRPMTKAGSMRLKCVASLVKVSNPQNNFMFRCIFQPVELLAISLRYGSWSVFKYIFKLVASYPRLRRLRQSSLVPGAFLE